MGFLLVEPTPLALTQGEQIKRGTKKDQPLG